MKEDTHTRRNPKEVFPGQYGIYDYYKETGDINTKQMVKHLSRKYKRKGMDYDKLERQINRIIKRSRGLSKMVEETNILLEENNLPVKTFEVKPFGNWKNPEDYYWKYRILPKDTQTRQNPGNFMTFIKKAKTSKGRKQLSDETGCPISIIEEINKYAKGTEDDISVAKNLWEEWC